MLYPNKGNEYVLGFMFSPDGSHVALIRKNRPEHLKDKWNGIGGKMGSYEGSYDAISREFKEETGISHKNWKWVGSFLRSNLDEQWKIMISIFAAVSDEIWRVQTITDELVEIAHVSQLGKEFILADNLDWMIPAAWDALNKNISFNVQETIGEISF